MARAYGSRSSLAGSHADPAAGVVGAGRPVAIGPPGPTPATKPCQTPASKSTRGTWVSTPDLSNRHSINSVGELGHRRSWFRRWGSRPARTGHPAAPRIAGSAASSSPMPRPIAPQDIAEGSHVTVAPPDGVSHDSGPSRLVGGSEAGAVVAVEVLVEHQVVLPGRVLSGAGLLPRSRAVGRRGRPGRSTPGVRAGPSDLAQRELLPDPVGTHLELVAEKPGVALEGLSTR